MEPKNDNSRLSTILGGVSAQDIVQYLSIEKIKNIIVIVVIVVVPVLFLITHILFVNAQLQARDQHAQEVQIRIDCHRVASQVFEDGAEYYDLYNNQYTYCIRAAGL